MKIKSIRKIDYNGPVYNLTVKDNHNFYANNTLVSNCHGAKAKSISEISKKCENAEYRLGFTGTMPDEKVDLLSIYDGLGPELYEMKSGELIDKGILSDITVANILMKYPSQMIKENCGREYQEEVRMITEYADRNKVFKWIFDNIPDGQNTLLLVTQIEHLNRIKEYLEKNLDPKYTVKIIHGTVKAKDREEIRISMDNEKNTILLASYGTMAVGVNIKRIHNIIFGTGRRSKIRCLQSLGRGLRIHHEKEKLILFDLVDDLTYEREITRGINKGKMKLETNYAYNHFLERLTYYTDQGFKYLTKRIKIEELL